MGQSQVDGRIALCTGENATSKGVYKLPQSDMFKMILKLIFVL